MDVLSILTLNLWGTGGPVAERMASLADWLRAQRPTIVALQEVEHWQGRSQAHHLAEAAGYAGVHVIRAGHAEDPGEGLAVLTELDGLAAATVTLPRAPDDGPRALQQVDLATDDGVIRVANTHLAWRLHHTTARSAQATRIVDELAAWTGPVVLAGDLNDSPGSPPLGRLAAAGLVDAVATAGDEGWTFHPDNPWAPPPELLERRVDYVLVRGLAVQRAAVVLTGQGPDDPVVSDHYGVLAHVADPVG